MSENPLYKYEDDLKELMHPKAMKSQLIPLGGIVSDVQYRYDKNGNKWALVALDTLQTSYQLYIFNEKFLKYESSIQEDRRVFIIGKDFNQSEGDMLSRLIVDKMYLLDIKLKEKIIKYLNIQIDYSSIDRNILDKIEQLSNSYTGSCSTVLHLITQKGKIQKILSNELKFSINSSALSALRELVGYKNVWLSL